MPPPPMPPPIGIGIIPMPLPAGAPAAAAAAPGGSSPIPDIAALTIRAGDDPCQFGGTDIAPTRRALPKPASAPPRPPIPPPSPLPIGAALLTNFAGSMAPAAPVAPASDAAFEPPIPA